MSAIMPEFARLAIAPFLYVVGRLLSNCFFLGLGARSEPDSLFRRKGTGRP